MKFVILGWLCLGIGMILGAMLDRYLVRKAPVIADEIDEAAKNLKDGLDGK